MNLALRMTGRLPPDADRSAVHSQVATPLLPVVTVGYRETKTVVVEAQYPGRR
jgi:hypothetical protein